MDVYIGFGLLSAGIVVVVFMIFDGWRKSRNSSMAELSGLHDKTMEDPEFIVNAEGRELQESFIESDDVAVSRTMHGIPHELKHAGLADLCDGNLEPEPFEPTMQFDLADEDMPMMSQPLESRPEAFEPITEEKRKPHPQTVEKTKEVLAAAHERNPIMPANLLVLSVMAKKDGRFESYDLFQAIAAAGMQYGEMNIFHYYQTTPVGKIALFSLASANKPGDFDLNNIAEFSCSGLMMFMDIAQVPDPQSAFKIMLEAAERLAEDLDGSLCADPMTPWNEKLVWQYHQKIMQRKTAVR
jgi:cell division protein ZipA